MHNAGQPPRVKTLHSSDFATCIRVRTLCMLQHSLSELGKSKLEVLQIAPLQCRVVQNMYCNASVVCTAHRGCPVPTQARYPNTALMLKATKLMFQRAESLVQIRQIRGKEGGE